MSLAAHVDKLLAEAFAAANLPVATAYCSPSARPDLADLQCNGIMPLAKEKGANPRALASLVVAALQRRPEFSEVTIAGPGFLNLRLSQPMLQAVAEAQIANPDLLIPQIRPAARIILDFGGPNVAKPLHVGHLRSLVIGESLRRILTALGNEVISDVHLGDWGLQMGMLISEIESRYPGLPCFDPQHPALPEGTLLLTMDDLQTLYPEAAAACKADPDRMEKARRATVLLQDGHIGYQLLWRALRAVSLNAQKVDIDRLGAHFDLWLGESDAQSLIPSLVELLLRQGVAIESDGALVVDVSEPNDTKPMPPLLLFKSDGAALYATTDLATLLDRSRKCNPDRVIYVVDQRQALHFEQVFRAARRTEFGKTMDLVHVGFGTVNGIDGKPYKTRQGGVARLSELLDEATQEARLRLSDDAGTATGSDEREQLAQQIAMASVKFADLQSHRLSGYIFDIKKLVTFEGRTGPYLQYACVRIASVLQKAREDGFTPGKIEPTEPTERAIILDCARFPEVVRSAGASFNPSEIADFAFSLAQNFSRFYADCPVLTADTQTQKLSRLSLCALTHAVLVKCLWLLNIEPPHRM